MSDHTIYTASITLGHRPTEGDALIFAEALQQFDNEWVHDGDNPVNTLSAYVQEYRCGEVKLMADALHTVFPDALEVLVYNEPAYEWLGDLVRYRGADPEPFCAVCDSDGNVLLDAAKVKQIIDNTDTRLQLVDELHKAIGEEAK